MDFCVESELVYDLKESGGDSCKRSSKRGLDEGCHTVQREPISAGCDMDI